MRYYGRCPYLIPVSKEAPSLAGPLPTGKPSIFWKKCRTQEVPLLPGNSNINNLAGFPDARRRWPPTSTC